MITGRRAVMKGLGAVVAFSGAATLAAALSTFVPIVPHAWAAKRGPSPSPREWTVTPDEEASLTDALANARPGDTIRLAAGNFSPPDRLTTAAAGQAGQPIVITGAGPGRTILRARGAKYGFWLTGRNDIIIANMTLEGYSGCGVKLINSHRCVLERLDINNSTSHNISLVGSDNCTIAQCRLTGSGRANGLTVTPNGGKGGRHNLISSNTAQANAHQGILITGSDNMIRQNLCQGNGSRDPYDHGLYIIGHNNRVIGNLSQGNRFGSGLRVGETGHLLKDNICRKNGRSGVVVAGTNDTRELVVVDNLLEGNGRCGVEINALKYKPDRIHVRGNSLKANRANVWIKDGARRVEIIGNLMADPLIVHVRIDCDPSMVTMKDNRFIGGNCKFSLAGRTTSAKAFFTKFEPGSACGAGGSAGLKAGPGVDSPMPWPTPGN